MLRLAVCWFVRLLTFCNSISCFNLEKILDFVRLSCFLLSYLSMSFYQSGWQDQKILFHEKKVLPQGRILRSLQLNCSVCPSKRKLYRFCVRKMRIKLIYRRRRIGFLLNHMFSCNYFPIPSKSVRDFLSFRHLLIAVQRKDSFSFILRITEGLRMILFCQYWDFGDVNNPGYLWSSGIYQLIVRKYQVYLSLLLPFTLSCG